MITKTTTNNKDLISRLESEHSLSRDEWYQLLDTYSDEDRLYAASKARVLADTIYGKDVFIRGIVEFSNICKNNCYYCGLRAANSKLERYRLSEEDIYECCRQGYEYGFRTFVLQSGEDLHYDTEMICRIVSTLKKDFPECAITLSIGEKSYEEYKAYREAGADRYLLRHETANRAHYERLHPEDMSWDNRMRCLSDLKKLGYQTGCGIMIGSPYQTTDCIVDDMLFMEKFRPELLPATTALGTIRPNGREQGILAGANVIMPNLSPVKVRDKYMLYDNKICTGDSSRECRGCIEARMKHIGYNVVISRGDYKVV